MSENEKVNDGGPAYPSGRSYDEPVGNNTYRQRRDGPLNPGMSLRDWFAGKALAGLLARDSGIEWGNCPTNEHYASRARDLADAMLRAREVQP